MPIRTTLRILALALLLVCYPRNGNSAARLPGMIGSHMVLQRDKPIHIWGWSDPGEKVAVALRGNSRSTAGDSLGDWSVFLPPDAAGGPYQLTVTAANQIVLDDVLIGDVWFASGQSNMEMPLKGFAFAAVKDSAAEVAQAAQPRMRLLHIPQKVADFPLRNSGASWTVCSPETAAGFDVARYRTLPADSMAVTCCAANRIISVACAGLPLTLNTFPLLPVETITASPSSATSKGTSSRDSQTISWRASLPMR